MDEILIPVMLIYILMLWPSKTGSSVESVQNSKIVLKCNYIYSLKISLNF